MLGTRMNEFDEELVDINTAGNLKSKAVIQQLRNELQLKPNELEASEHLLHDNGLTGDLLPMVDQCLPGYKRLIEDNISDPAWAENKDLAPYIAKEKTKLLEAMKVYKTEKAKKLIAENNDEYSRQCSAALPNQYIQLTNTYYYFKKNIIIAIYNAARDYYKIILKAHGEKPTELAEKITSFNSKFKPIAHIDPQTQIMSPLNNAFTQLLHLPLIKDEIVTSFESSIDDLIKRCAHTNYVLGQYGDAFRCVQKRLNDFNSKEYIDPLTGTKMTNAIFKPIAAPGEDSKASVLLYIPLATTTANLGSTLKSAVAGDAEQFTFTAAAKKLDDRVKQSKLEFHAQLIVLNDYLQKVRGAALSQLEGNEKSFDYDRTRENIYAYSGLLSEQTNIHARLNAGIRTITTLLKQVAPKISARTEFTRLASEHKLDVSVTELEACVFDEESDKNLDNIQNDLTLALVEHGEIREAIDKMIAESFDKDSMFKGDTFFLQHTEEVAAINARIKKQSEVIASIQNRISDHTDNKKNAELLIQTFEIFKSCQDKVEQYATRYTNHNLSLPRVQNATNDILLPAISFYQDAHLAYQALEDEVRKQHATILTTRTQFMKSAKKEHFEILAACLDQIIRQSNQQLQEARQIVTDSQKDTNLLLLCHLYVNAILNLEYWQTAKRITDSTRDIKSGSLVYHIPAAIGDLINIIKNEAFAGWENNPEFATLMLEALHTQAKTTSHNAKVESLLAYLRNPINIIAPDDTEKLRATSSDLSKICNHTVAEFEPVIIRPQRLTTITPTPTFWELHPILKKGLFGVLAGLAIMLLVAIIIGIIVATHGIAAAALVGAFQALAVAVGSTGAAVAALTAASAGVVAIAGAIGSIIGLAQYEPVDVLCPPDDIHLVTTKKYDNSSSLALSQLGYSVSASDEEQFTPRSNSQSDENEFESAALPGIDLENGERENTFSL